MARIALCKRMMEEYRPITQFLADVSRETGHEMAVTVCQAKDGTVYPDLVCVGNECGVTIYGCGGGEKALFNVHTHPIAPEPAPSPGDIITAISLGYPACVISSSTGKVGCLHGIDNTTLYRVNTNAVKKTAFAIRDKLLEEKNLTWEEWIGLPNEERVKAVGMDINLAFLREVLDKYPFLRYCESSLND